MNFRDGLGTSLRSSVRCSASPLSIQRRRRRKGLEEFRQREFIGFPFESLADALELEDDNVGSQEEVEELMRRLSRNLVDERIQRIQSVVEARTYSVLPIVENLYDMGNLSAVIRSADAFGFGAVHSIHSDLTYKQSARTSGGSEKWLDARVWQASEGGKSATWHCLTSIKKAGYRVVVTHLRKGALEVSKIDWTQPTAFVLGNEKSGVTDEAVELADDCAIIPMTGFVESFNVSVAAALIMYTAQQQRIAKLGSSGDLSADEKTMLTAALMLRSVREGPTLMKELLSRPAHKWQVMNQRED